MSRPTNQELVEQMRVLLTTGFVVEPPNNRTAVLEATKPWRNKVWHLMNEIELRLDPLKAIQKERHASDKSIPRPTYSD